MDAMKNIEVSLFPRQSKPVARSHGAAPGALDARSGVEAAGKRNMAMCLRRCANQKGGRKSACQDDCYRWDGGLPD